MEGKKEGKRKYPLLVKFGSRYTEDLYIVNTEQEFFKLFLYMLKWRHKNKWYKFLLLESDIKRYNTPDYTQEDVDKMEIGKSKSLRYTKQSLQSQLDRYIAQKKLADEAGYIYKEIEDACRFLDGPAAYDIMFKLRDKDEFHAFGEVKLKKIEELEKLANV